MAGARAVAGARQWMGAGAGVRGAAGLVRPHVAQLPLSPTLGINETVAGLRAAGRRVFHFGFGQSPFPVPQLVQAALRRHAAEKDYLPVRGLPRLQEAVAAHMRPARPQRPDLVAVGPGSKQLLFQMFLLFSGPVALPAPAWVSYLPQLQLAGGRPLLLPTDAANRWHVQPDALEELCQAHAGERLLLLLNSPCNPTGQCYTRAEMEALVAVCRRHGVVLLADEIYGLVHHADAHVSFAELYPEGAVVSSGLSKWCGAGGWRLGYMAFPEQLADLLPAMDAVASETFSATSAPVQHAAVAAYGPEPELEEFRQGQRAVLAAAGSRVHRILRDADVASEAPTGGFYLFADFEAHREQLAARGIRTSAELCGALLEEAAVALLPGSAFMRPPEELTTRLSFVNFDGGAALEAWKAGRHSTPDDGFLDAHCPDTVAGAAAIAEWLGR